jgi:hypothetical protein
MEHTEQKECFGTYQARKNTSEESNYGYEKVGTVSGIKKNVIKKEITEIYQELKTPLQIREKFLYDPLLYENKGYQ